MSADDITIQGFVPSSAVISPCGRYRYSLTRRWDVGPTMCFVMLNPSTASAVDDPTIRRCVGFARREGCAGIEVVNLFALRATDPRELVKAGASAVGPSNLLAIEDAVSRAGLVVLAWGSSVPRQFRAWTSEIEVSIRVAVDARCLGTTKSGDPRHPLYVRGDQPLVPWGGAA